MQPCFEADKSRTSVMYSCSVTFKNTVYVFGGYFGSYYGVNGYKHKMDRQISILSGRQLKRISDSQYSIRAGTGCANLNNQGVYLCRERVCHYSEEPSNGTNFVEIGETLNDHSWMGMAGSKCK